MPPPFRIMSRSHVELLSLDSARCVVRGEAVVLIVVLHPLTFTLAYCTPGRIRAAVLELVPGELEPRVEHFECVDHPDRLNRPDRCVDKLKPQRCMLCRSTIDIMCYRLIDRRSIDRCTLIPTPICVLYVTSAT